MSKSMSFKTVFNILDILFLVGAILLIVKSCLLNKHQADYSPYIIADGNMRIAISAAIVVSVYIAIQLFRLIYCFITIDGVRRTDIVLLLLSKILLLLTVLSCLFILIKLFKQIMIAGDISPTVLSEGMKNCLIVIPTGLLLTITPLIAYMVKRIINKQKS